MPDTTKYRALLATVLEEEGLTLHGLTPFARWRIICFPAVRPPASRRSPARQ